MNTRYFVKFIGDKNVTVAVARSENDAETLLANNYEETTADFYNWVQSNTRKIS